MSGYKLHAGAKEDLNEIWDYLADEASPSVASQIENEFFEAFALISTQPRMGFQRENLVSRPVRFWVMRECAVIHGKQHPRTIARILAGRH